jgi:small subunit ribosomal protein S17
MEKVTRTKTGVVVSDKMDKTVVVKVDSRKRHPKYKKTYQVSKKFKAHDEKNEYHTGDKVEIRESKPLSKDKNYTVVRKID